jgi:DNA/RNA endonuclease YhcR with UshA esterase domain
MQKGRENKLSFKNLFKRLSLVLSLTVMATNTSLAWTVNAAEAEGATAADLFISEYIEGSSNNKALEIYNGTGAEVDLSQYKVELYSNGSVSVGNKLDMTGTLANGEVYVIANSQAVAAILDKADITSTVTYFNGDDAVVLKHDGVIIDAFGQVGFDPGSAWTSGEVTTVDKTLIRKSSIKKGDSNASDVFDPAAEWNLQPKDYFEDLGRHTMEGSAEPVVVPLTGINVPEAEVELLEGNTHKLNFAYDPVNTTEVGVQWNSDHEEIASIASDGTVTAVKDGVAVITVTSTVKPSISAKVKVSVKKAPDTTAPVVTKLIPEDDAVLEESAKTDTIGAEYNDGSGYGIDKVSVKLSLDGTDVTVSAVINETSASYKAENPFDEGEHTIILEVSDKLGNKTTKTWSFNIGAAPVVEYNHYYGQLHSHTNLSDGLGTPDDAFTHARDTAGVDFLAITDHSNWFDNEKDLVNETITDLSLSTSSEWKNLHAVADKYNKNGEFIAIAGFEMTWSGSTGGYGHINTFNTPWFVSRSNSKMDLQTFYNRLAADHNSIAQLNHPGKTFGDFSDFALYSPEVDKVVNLIEVGNGEGAVRSSGYFESYEYYTRALDKGWHLAPSNNQDNHKGLWGDANTAKTVIIAEKLTRDALYEAIRERRVYATEDDNLKIEYTVNGKQMGTILSEASELNTVIKIADASEPIGKVSIIVDGGTVVGTKTFDSSTAEWELKLPSGYNYYYIRVDQADKDIAVSAPIWAGTVVPVGISKVEVSQNPQIVDNPVEVTATLYNNGSAALEGVKVEFYEGSIGESHKIGESTISGLGASSTATAVISWTPKTTGDIKVIARTGINYAGVDKVFTQDTTIKVANSEDLVKVVIDGGHFNQYVSGNYAGKMETLKEMMKENGYMLVQNPDELTAADLENAKLLILTDPQGYDDKYGKAKNYSIAELEVIKNFVEDGGHIMITSRADYDDTKVKAGEEYENAAQSNAVLAVIGSNLRFNDDEVIDKTSNGGQEFRLYFDKYIGSKYGLTDNIPNGQTYSFYSGCSVMLLGDADDSKIDWIVKGHDTTEILDSDKQNDATLLEKGNIYALAAEELESGSKVIVAGSTFFSDFETASGDDAYTNKAITANVLKWMLSEQQPQLKTIAEVRVDANKDGIPDNLGRRYAIEGIVTAQSEAVTPKNAFFEVIYVQDETGGITVFGVSATPLLVGQKVRITGMVQQYNGDAEIEIKNETRDLQIVTAEVSAVNPKNMSTLDSMKEENEGWLVKIQGRVTKMNNQNLWVDDGTGEARAYVEGYIGDGISEESKGKWNPAIKVGDTVSIIGLASEDAEGHRLRVRNTTEIVKVTNSEEPGSGNETPGNGNGNPGTGTENPGTGTQNPGTGTEEPGTDPVEPGTGTEGQGTGTEQPGTGTQQPEKLPQTGSPIDFALLMAIGVILVGAGIRKVSDTRE